MDTLAARLTAATGLPWTDNLEEPDSAALPVTADCRLVVDLWGSLHDGVHLELQLDGAGSAVSDSRDLVHLLASLRRAITPVPTTP